MNINNNITTARDMQKTFLPTVDDHDNKDFGELNDMDFLIEDDDEEGLDTSTYIFDETEDGNDDKSPEWNLINAFNEVLKSIQNQYEKLTPRGMSAFEYLTERLKMTKLQVAVISILINAGKALSWAGIGHELHKSRLTVMAHTEEVEELVNKRRWLINKAAHERGGDFEGFALVPGVIRAIRHDKVFEPENLTGLDEQTFVERMASRIQADSSNHDVCFSDCERWLEYLVKENLHLPLCKFVDNMHCDIHNKCLFLLFVTDYSICAGMPNEGLSLHNIDSYFPEDWKCEGMRKALSRGTHELIRKGYIENKCSVDGIADPTTFVLGQKAKDEFLTSFKPSIIMNESRNKPADRDLLHYTEIAEKKMYYNAREGQQMKRLHQILSKEQFSNIQKRLEAKGMRTGVAILLSGGPGTGKTESVRQLARKTGRDLLMIDISQVKDKFVGESEKNTKAIFERYKNLCKKSDIKPILFINECDAILGKRLENPEHSAEKMQNSMQNILLQALEDLDGIMICTTNLVSSLDSAFERRFLMKVEFDKPDTDVRANIWKAMIPTLTHEEAKTLAERYVFSGGQCENVMRKATIEEVINGTQPTLEQLDAFCKEETMIQKSNLRPIIGFAA